MRDLYSEFERENIELVAVADMDFFDATPMSNIENICGVDICIGINEMDDFDDMQFSNCL